MELDATFETTLSPEQAVAALTDFSEARLATWKDSLDPDKFEVYEVGETTARVREGSKMPNVWAIERYEFGPGRVSARVEESNFCKPGSGVDYSIESGADGGSRVDLHWRREPANLKGWLLIAPMKIVGPKMLAMNHQRAFDRYGEALAD